MWYDQSFPASPSLRTHGIGKPRWFDRGELTKCDMKTILEWLSAVKTGMYFSDSLTPQSLFSGNLSCYRYFIAHYFPVLSADSRHFVAGWYECWIHQDASIELLFVSRESNWLILQVHTNTRYRCIEMQAGYRSSTVLHAAPHTIVF